MIPRASSALDDYDLMGAARDDRQARELIQRIKLEEASKKNPWSLQMIA